MNRILESILIICVIAVLVGMPFTLGGHVFGVSDATAGTNYYISSSLGNDDNDGLTPETAWRTLYKCYEKSIFGPHFAPGDSILLKRGDSWANILRIKADGTEAEPIVIGPYGEGQTPVLYGHVAPTPWDSVVGHPGVYSAPVEMETIFATVFDGPTRLQVVPSTGLDLLDLTDIETYLNSFPPGSFGPDWGGTGRNSNGNTDIVWVRTGDDSVPADVKLFWHAPINVLRPSSYITIEDLVITESEFGIDIEGSDHIVVRDNVISDIVDLGVYLRWDNTNCLVQNNDISRTGNNGLYILTGSDNILRGNVVSQVGDSVMGIPSAGDQCGIGLQESRNNLVEYNTVSNIESQGVDFYREEGTTMRYNYFYNVGQGSVPYGTDLKVHHNIFDVNWQPGGNGRGMNVVNTGGGTILIYNNVYYRVSAGISVSTAEDSVVYRNNIIYSINPDDWLIWFINDNVYSDYNLFHGSEKIRAPSGVWYTSLADYQATGHETHSFLDEPEFISSNPASALDFQLASTSPAVDEGQNLQFAGLIAPTDSYLDFVGVAIPQGGAPDLGAFESEPVSVAETPQTPGATLLKQNAPNPFNPFTKIQFSTKTPGTVVLRIYDLAGRPIRTLLDGWREPRRYEIAWDGRDNTGNAVASGVYFYQLEAPGYLESKKMVLLK